MAWAARNYMIYLKITNLGTGVLLAFTFLGGALYFFKIDSNPMTDFNGVFGVLFGIGLAFLVKGMTVGSVITISRVFDLNIYESGIAAEIAKRNVLTLNRYFDNKHFWAIVWVFIIFITDTVSLLLFGYFFGNRGSPGFLLGHIVIILFLMSYSVINGTAMK
jgi:NADH:ubiquinone oxidoreductase subunit 3 (subunit A)